MKYKIVLATLKGCKSCESLKNILFQNNIKFIDVPCENDPGMCDELEKLTKSSKYPIAIIKDLTKNLDYVYFTGINYNELGKEVIIDEKLRLVSYLTPDQLVYKINSIK
jgi:glutaredoxin